MHSHYKILLVEDELLPMTVHQKLLTSLGYLPDQAVNATDAVNMSKNGYDLIFMDIGLPDFIGIEATRQIREYELTQYHQKRVKIIALTGFSLDEVGHLCVAAGMDDIANKPISKDEIRALIEKHLF